MVSRLACMGSGRTAGHQACELGRACWECRECWQAGLLAPPAEAGASAGAAKPRPATWRTPEGPKATGGCMSTTNSLHGWRKSVATPPAPAPAPPTAAPRAPASRCTHTQRWGGLAGAGAADEAGCTFHPATQGAGTSRCLPAGLVLRACPALHPHPPAPGQPPHLTSRPCSSASALFCCSASWRSCAAAARGVTLRGSNSARAMQRAMHSLQRAQREMP